MILTIRLLTKHAAALLTMVLLAGCAMFGDKNAASIQIFEQVGGDLPGKMVRQVTVPKTGLTIPVAPYPSLTDRDLHEAQLVPTPAGAAIMLRFDPTGIMVLSELTTRCRGRYLVTFFNGRPVAAWLCDRMLDKGQWLVEGDFTDEEAKTAVESLNKAAKKRDAL
jgi:hypothetical protein